MKEGQPSFILHFRLTAYQQKSATVKGGKATCVALDFGANLKKAVERKSTSEKNRQSYFFHTS